MLSWSVTQEQQMLFILVGPVTTLHLTQGLNTCPLITSAEALMEMQTVESQLLTPVSLEITIVMWAHHLS